MRILLDNGHGENTPGKRSPVWPDGTQLYEYEFNRDIARRVHNALRGRGVDCELLVRENVDVPVSYTHLSKFENERLRNWYKNEIEGYRDKNNIPDYRKITAESCADIILFGGARVIRPIDISKIPDESIRELLTKAIIAKPLCEVEALSYCGEETIKLDLTSFLGQYIHCLLYTSFGYVQTTAIKRTGLQKMSRKNPVRFLHSHTIRFH